MEIWFTGNKPHFNAATAHPDLVWVCESAQSSSNRPPILHAGAVRWRCVPAWLSGGRDLIHCQSLDADWLAACKAGHRDTSNRLRTGQRHFLIQFERSGDGLRITLSTRIVDEHTFMIRSLRNIQAITALAAICLSPFAVQAQAVQQPADEIEVIHPAHPVWLLEQPDAKNPLLTARTFGDSAYGDFHVNATLQVSCYPQSQKARFTLQIAPASLGFDSDPFEGPDATANGPLNITTGTRTTVDHRVSGSWTSGGTFQVGSLFSISTDIPPPELDYWVGDASRGQSLNLSLAPAKAGDKRLTATFSLPENNDGLKQVIQLCLGAAKVAPEKPKRD